MQNSFIANNYYIKKKNHQGIKPSSFIMESCFSYSVSLPWNETAKTQWNEREQQETKQKERKKKGRSLDMLGADV